nr:MAG TPA: hypothetical protein [Caudoviricetes sp.]
MKHRNYSSYVILIIDTLTAMPTKCYNNDSYSND